MILDTAWVDQFQLDIDFGYVAPTRRAPRNYNPRLVLNDDVGTVAHALVEEIRRCDHFTFSVAFISSSAIAQLKQHLIDFKGNGRIVTADFLGFNPPEAFAELLSLKNQLGIDVRRHSASGFHPKGYIFGHQHNLTAMIGSSNLTSAALSHNHEWNLKVSAALGSDLASQLNNLVAGQVAASAPLTQEWIDEYAADLRRARPPTVDADSTPPSGVPANRSERDAARRPSRDRPRACAGCEASHRHLRNWHRQDDSVGA